MIEAIGYITVGLTFVTASFIAMVISLLSVAAAVDWVRANTDLRESTICFIVIIAVVGLNLLVGECLPYD